MKGKRGAIEEPKGDAHITEVEGVEVMFPLVLPSSTFVYFISKEIKSLQGYLKIS